MKAFNDKEVDLSIDLWTKNVRRVQQAYLSEPLIYKRRSFLTSSENSNVQQSEMDILPLGREVVGCFAAAAVLLGVLLAFAKVPTSTPTIYSHGRKKRLGGLRWCKTGRSFRVPRRACVCGWIIW